MRLIKEMSGHQHVMLKKHATALLAEYDTVACPRTGAETSQAIRPQARRRVVELGRRSARLRRRNWCRGAGGAACFIADLMQEITVPTAVDFMAISSYEGNGGSAVRIHKDLDENIKGRDVILVEDIIDTGMTLNHLIDYLNTKRPASVKVCALLDKRARRIADVPVEYVGFEILDEFVVGYGLDYQQRFRNLPFVAVLKHQLLP
jgi:hypoxanthine phosphoribosyltransferase